METEKSKIGLKSSISPDEMKDAIPKEISAAYKFLEEGDFKRAKTIANSAAKMNRQVNLAGIDDELKVLFEKIRVKRAEASKRNPS
jgi:hypothetical protein